MMKSTVVGINSWTQELLLEIISPAIEQLLNRNCTVDPALMPGSFEGVWGIWVITWLRWLSLMRDDDHNTPERKKRRGEYTGSYSAESPTVGTRPE